MSEEKSLNFIEEIVEEDLKAGKYKTILTRFPPEPNGYLHIGHAKSICLNFGLAKKYGGATNLRFDDTNPVKEETEYVDSIKEDVQWLGFNWANEFYASDYFEQLYQFAVTLIQKGLAYVDDSSSEAIAEQKGTPTQPGVENEFRNRTIEENLLLFAEMRVGKYTDGEKVLRAKIDMAASNMHMRDPLLYRIKHAHHHRTGDAWCIYPMYDFAHGQSDSIEKITHSICTLEFVPHRELYDWLIEKLEIFPSRQYEFARLNMTYTVMSKRKLLQLVNEGHVTGWDDPRMPTLSGMRRRGYTPEAIRDFCASLGVSKTNGITQLQQLEYYVRQDLNKHAQRVMAVLNPLKVVLTNYPDDLVEEMEAVNNPEDATAGTRKIPFSKTLYIEQDDFREVPPPKYYRLSPGKEVRLRYGYIIKCESVVKDADGNVIEVHCTYDPDSRSGGATSNRKVKATIHWVSAAHAIDAEVHNYDTLFSKENPDDVEEGQDFTANLNPNSLEVLTGCKVEPGLKDAAAGSRYQFERLGYFCVDPDSYSGKPIFNKTIGLKDTWAKIEQREKK